MTDEQCEAWDLFCTAQPGLVGLCSPAQHQFLLTGGGIGAPVLAAMHRAVMPRPFPWLKSSGRL